MNVEEGSQSESLTENSKDKLDQMTQADYFNFCVPLRPILGAFSIEKREIVVKEKRQRQPRNREQVSIICMDFYASFLFNLKEFLIVVNCLICHLFSWLYREFSTRSLMRLVKKIKTLK